MNRATYVHRPIYRVVCASGFILGSPAHLAPVQALRKAAPEQEEGRHRSVYSNVSKAGRDRMSAAQKDRWAKLREPQG